MANEIQFGYRSGATLTYIVNQPDGTARTTSTSLPEVSTSQYVASDANIVAGDMQIAYEGTNEVGQGIYQPEVTSINLTAIAASVWDVLTSSITTVGSIGVWILEKLDVVVSTRATSAKQDTMETTLNAVNTKIGTPADIDTGGATLADNLKKMADDNGGDDFDATTDSLEKIRNAVDATSTGGTPTIK